MKTRGAWLIAALCLVACIVQAQSPVIHRFVPGNYLVDNTHLVELYNPSGNPVRLGGYLLVTRDYSVRLPGTARIGGRSSFSIAKLPGPNVDLALSQTPDFLIRFHFLEQEGHYVALFSPEMEVLDAAYFSPSSNVPFLPDRDTCITFDGERIPFYLPPENRSEWEYVRTVSGKPGNFVKANGRWQAQGMVVAAPPPTAYDDLILRYEEGIMTVKWVVTFEQDCKRHVIERCEDQIHFVPVGTVVPEGDSKVPRAYSFLEKGLEEKHRYYYRIKGEDGLGNAVYSAVREVMTEEVNAEFSMEVIPGAKAGEEGFSLRFISAYSQQVRIKLFDENMREVALLFNDYVFAGTPNLIRMGVSLQGPQRYLVMATTGRGRYGVEFVAD